MIVEIWCRPWKYPPSQTWRPLMGAVWVATTDDPTGALEGAKRTSVRVAEVRS